VAEWRVPPRVLALGVYGLFGFHFLLFMALRSAPPVEANLVNYLWPLLIVVLAPAILPGTAVRARQVAGAAAGFLGAALLVTGGEPRLDPAHAAGYALAAGSALVWATYSLASKRLAAFPTATVGLFCAVSGALALACHVLFEPRYVPAADEWPWLVALGLGPMGAAFFLWDYALKHGDPRRIGALAYLTPLLSTLALVAVGAGALTPLTLAAIVLIVGGAALGATA
jgi:drug/metabolite transporter (DMT)-like permease